MWTVQHGVLKTARYAIQQNCDIEAKYEPNPYIPNNYGLRLLDIAICRRDYTMIQLLIESGAEIHDTDIQRASAPSCQTIIWHFIETIYRDSCHQDSNGLISKALHAATKMGHDELVGLVSRQDQMDSSIWSLLVEAVRSCEDNISNIRLFLDKVAEIADKKKRQYLLSQ